MSIIGAILLANINIRRGVPEDASSVFELALQLKILQPSSPAKINKDEFLIAFGNVLKPRDNETNVLYVAEDEKGNVIGYSLMAVSRLLHTSGLSAFLQELVVSESTRGKGIGSALVRANEHYCHDRGVRQLSMATQRAGDFYNRLGYVRAADYYKKELVLG